VIWGGVSTARARISRKMSTVTEGMLRRRVRRGMTRGEGEELINCMASAGVLLRFHDAVYLRPSVCI